MPVIPKQKINFRSFSNKYLIPDILSYTNQIQNSELNTELNTQTHLSKTKSEKESFKLYF